MKLPPLLLCASLLLVACSSSSSKRSPKPEPRVERTPAALNFDDLFTGQTLRWDYVHMGSADEQHIGSSRVRLEGPWAGSRKRLVDDTDLGKYLFEVVDPDSQRLLYSRGFASIYGEWATTGEAKQGWGSFHESQRFPEPRRPVELILHERGPDGRFQRIHSTQVDPAGRFVDRSLPTSRGEVIELQICGPSAVKVDLLFLAEGYTTDQRGKFEQDVKRLTKVLFATEPYRHRKADFNVRGLFVEAAVPGISNPRAGLWRDTPFGSSFNAFDSDRYVLTYSNERLRDQAAAAPYDALVILCNVRKYGGGGIFNLWSTCAADSKEAPYLLVHEMGHSFAGLADEYYSSQVSYEEFNPPGSEPWEPNVTALLDPAKLKWRDLTEPGTPLPTPWNKPRYDELDLEYQAKRSKLRAEGAPEQRMEALFDEVRRATQPLLEAEPYFGKVGAFEGAAYEPRGMYRPQADCIMFTRNPTWFCKVCERAIGRVIDLYAE